MHSFVGAANEKLELIGGGLVEREANIGRLVIPRAVGAQSRMVAFTMRSARSPPSTLRGRERRDEVSLTVKLPSTPRSVFVVLGSLARSASL